MNSDLLIQQSQVFYLLREGLWKTTQVLCHKFYQRNQDPFFQFWRAFCYFKSGSLNEAINELTLIRNKREFQFATSAALIYYSQQQRGVDREIIETCRQMQSEGRKTPNDRAFQSAIYFYLFLDEGRKAKEVLELLSQGQPISQITLGWYKLLQKDEQINITEVLDYFQSIGGQFNQKPIEYLLGLAKASEINKKYPIILDALNELMIVWRDFPFTDVEKLRFCIFIQDWEQFQDLANKILYDDPTNIFGLKAIAFYNLARKGDVRESIEKMEELFNAIQKQEEDNVQLLLNCCQLLSRVSGRNQLILQLTISQIQKMRKVAPLLGDLCLELAQETLMLEEYEKAYGYFQEAVALDEGRTESLAGMIQCKILQGVIDDAEKQLEFVQEVQVSVGRTTEIAFLQALLESKKSEGTDSPIAQQFIEETLKLHLTQSKQLLPGYEFYIKFNPDFTFTIAQMYLRNLSTNLMLAGKEQTTSGIGKGTKLLESIAKQAPGLTNVQLLLATGKMALGDPQEALKTINRVLELDPKNEDGYILHALISIKTKQINLAANSLNQAISNNFAIRENPLFMLVKGEVEYRTEDYKNAQITLEAAFELVAGKYKNKIKVKSKIVQFTEKDKCQVFVLLAKVYAVNKKEVEAKRIMQKAIQEYAGSPHESTIMMANSEIAIESGDIKKAINILKAVQSGQPNFVNSRMILADVYLKYLKDRRNYTKCYAEIIEAEPTAENYKLIGEAFMKINEPQEAVLSYQKAAELYPEDEEITRTIGNALTMTYDYQKAVNYYEAALLKTPGRQDLLVDLGRLYLRMNNIQKAEQILVWEKFLTDDYAAPSLTTLRANAQGFLLIARMITKLQQATFNQAQNAEKEKIQQQLMAESQKQIEKIRKAFEYAVSTQKDVIEKSKQEAANVNKEKEQLGLIFLEQARYFFNNERNYKATLDCIEDGIKYIPTNESLIQLQAETFYQNGDKISCEQKLKILQKLNPKNDYASMMLSELVLQQDDSEKSIQQFVQTLQEKPNSFGTLSKVIDWYRKQNRLDEIQVIIDNCAKATQNQNEPGLCFCRGLYYKYKNLPKEALIQFNYAKKHQQYAEDSLTYMIDLYLNPDQDLYYSITDEQPKPVAVENLKACDQLLKELQNRGSMSRYLVMQAQVLQLSGNPKSIEMANGILGQLLKSNREWSPAMLSLAINKFLSKKQTEGKTILKLLWAKQADNSGWERDELERAWLLHADAFISIQKYDQAEEILRKCLKQNKCCAKAEELMGLIKEKEQSYIDASNSYEKAFKLTNQRNPIMGYRLAFNYLKAKRFVDAINICKLILKINPAFPKLQSEILNKAIQALKP
ncbi:unnamed protein product [Paramecium sonneborni]|uniref:Tetratricopeptide repeat protein n=1 Tax=Paramecium sonneborni TaxID=65129 RepID=A0A8S1LKS8_9CILI|nr:unnamed protein product [Paramecium sonneborni]